MNVLVGVCVHDRIENVNRWLKCYKENNVKSKLAICHNIKNNLLSKDITSKVDYYIPRNNIGYDLGFFQDIINKKYIKDLNWNVLIWFTDDFIPMKKNFLKLFIEKISLVDVGLVGACFEPSNEVNKYHHFRTNAFAIKREVAKNIVFPACPMTNRSQCLDLEHGENNITIQIEKMGFKCIPVVGSPYPKEGYSHWANNDFMVDSGHPISNNRLNWKNEFDKEFAN